MGYDNHLLFPISVDHLSIFLSYSGNDLICPLLVGLPSAPEKTDFVLANALTVNPALLLGPL